MDSQFQLLIDYINENEVILRSDLEYVLNLHMKTADPYRRKLEVVGFIKKEGRGRYVRLKEIPKDYTTVQLYKDYSNKNSNDRWTNLLGVDKTKPH